METRQIIIGGKNYRVSSDDQYLAAMGDDFEPHMVQLFQALIGPDDVVADIGANIGLTALLFSSMSRQVYAFEPSPSTFRILQENLRLNDVKNVQAINLGLGQKTETLTITFAKNNRSGGFVSEKIRLGEGHTTEEIRIDTFDHFFAEKATPPSFLKVDVEGFEQNVIRGGAGLLAKHQPTVVMEMNHFCLDVLQRITIPDFLDFMRSAFPVLYAIDTDNATVVDLHVPEKAYSVMHEHVVKHRFPNLVGGFSPEIKSKLDTMASRVTNTSRLIARAQSAVQAEVGRLVNGQTFKTPALEQIQGALLADSVPAKMSPGTALEIPITLKNEGNNIWYGYGSHPVLLSYHWLNADGSIYKHDGLRTTLACKSLGPEMGASETIIVIPPQAQGCYQLVLTLVQEGVCWFEDRGLHCATAHVVVE